MSKFPNARTGRVITVKYVYYKRNYIHFKLIYYKVNRFNFIFIEINYVHALKLKLILKYDLEPLLKFIWKMCENTIHYTNKLKLHWFQFLSHCSLFILSENKEIAQCLIFQYLHHILSRCQIYYCQKYCDIVHKLKKTPKQVAGEIK